MNPQRKTKSLRPLGYVAKCLTLWISRDVIKSCCQTERNNVFLRTYCGLKNKLTKMKKQNWSHDVRNFQIGPDIIPDDLSNIWFCDSWMLPYPHKVQILREWPGWFHATVFLPPNAIMLQSSPNSNLIIPTDSWMSAFLRYETESKVTKRPCHTPRPSPVNSHTQWKTLPFVFLHCFISPAYTNATGIGQRTSL